MNKLIIIIALFIFLLVFNRLYIDSIVESIYERLNPSVKTFSDLQKNKIEKILFKAIPRKHLFNQHQISKNCFIVIHGYNTFPKSMEKLTIALKEFRCDIYSPLMKYHGYGIRKMKDFNNSQISETLLEDINYVSSMDYQKIFCIGYSYSGLQLLNLSSKDLLKKNLYMILINPALKIKNDSYMFIVLVFISMIYSSYIFKNYNLFSSYNLRMKTVDENKIYFYEYCEYLYVKIVMIRVIMLSKRIQKEMSKFDKYIRNKFAIIFATDDRLISSKESKKLVKNQKNLRGFFEVNGGHDIPFDDNHIGNLLNKIKACMSNFET